MVEGYAGAMANKKGTKGCTEWSQGSGAAFLPALGSRLCTGHVRGNKTGQAEKWPKAKNPIYAVRSMTSSVHQDSCCIHPAVATAEERSTR